MKIDFLNIKDKILPNFNGGEKQFIAKMHIDENNKILKGKLIPGASIGMHCHDTSSEIIFFIKGNAKMITDGVEERYKEGDCHYCEKGSSHTMINDTEEDIIFYAVVPQHN